MDNNETTNNSFIDKMNEMPPEFIIALENYRELHFNDVLYYLFKILGDKNDFFSMPQETQEVLMNLFMKLHNWGFYGGVNFTLDPGQEYKPQYLEEQQNQESDKK